MKFIEYTEMLKALGENTRLHIFDMLRNGTLCGCKILEQLNITQPTLSHHMKVLCDCGLVRQRKTGNGLITRLTAKSCRACFPS